MATLVKKAKQFKKIFSKEEKLVIILSSLVTILAIVLGFMGIICLLKWYVESTAPHMANALNNLVGALFEGWTFF